MNKIEACEKIIEQYGNCTGLICGKCPLYNTSDCLNDQDVLNEAKQYLAEHKTSAADDQEKTYPVEFTAEELKYIGTGESFVLATAKSVRIKIDQALKKINEPQPGDRCAFWDDDKSRYFVGILEHFDNENKTDKNYLLEHDEWFKNCAKIKKEAEF